MKKRSKKCPQPRDIHYYTLEIERSDTMFVSDFAANLLPDEYVGQEVNVGKKYIFVKSAYFNEDEGLVLVSTNDEKFVHMKIKDKCTKLDVPEYLNKFKKKRKV
jgi:hypothetical protein